MTEDIRPLAGIRVIEMTHMIMGPSCGMFLALLGADVIKVEPPEGDKTRHLTGMGRGFYPTFNRGKKSITLDLKCEAGRAALHRLLEGADVFVENFRDQSLAKMGFAPDILQARYPRLIVSSLKGFLKGPYENRTAMDEVVQMMTGMAGKGIRERMQMVRQMQAGIAGDPAGGVSRQKQGTGKRLSPKEKAKLKKERDRLIRKKKREQRGG